jgi:hypothetical protein
MPAWRSYLKPIWFAIKNSGEKGAQKPSPMKPAKFVRAG